MPHMISLSFPIPVEQVEKLHRAVAVITASRKPSKQNQRITKAAIVRVLLEVFRLEDVNLEDIPDEKTLKDRVEAVLTNGKPQNARLDPHLLAEIYRKFASNEQKKWIAGDFINTLFENGLVESSSSEELWEKILRKME
ncbi:MAG TPA: hypothetical protein PLF96_08540 [Thermotogota bacterium]|nr:hypothetical protein [Thermotogota bacterium]